MSKWLELRRRWLPPLLGVILALALTAGVNLFELNQEKRVEYAQPASILGAQSIEVGKGDVKASQQDLTAERVWQHPTSFYTLISIVSVALAAASAAYLTLNRLIINE